MVRNLLGGGGKHRRAQLRQKNWAIAGMLLSMTGTAWSFEIDTGNADIAIRWDNNLRYTYAHRVHDQDKVILRNNNNDDGDRNFNKGTVLNRIDLLSEFDFTYKGVHGFRVSGAAWYDPTYGGGFDNSSLATSNRLRNGTPAHGISSYAKSHYYRGGELLDAFVFGQAELGEMKLNAKFGRHAVFWGESLGFGGLLHSIAYSQGPTDVAKAFATPGVDAKELFRPLNSLSLQLQVNESLSLAVQKMLDWEPVRLPEGGTYFGTNDAAQWGGQTVFVGAARVLRADDITTNNKRRDYGLALRWSPEALDGTLGVYYRNFTDTLPQVLADLRSTPDRWRYRMAYADDIDLYGLSLSKNIAGISFGVELSYRKNMPLVSDTAAVGAAIAGPFNTTYFPVDGDVPGARGNTAHAVFNMLGVLGKTPIFDTASWNAELAYSRWLKVTEREYLFKGRNGYNLIDRVSKDAWQLSLGFTPTWFQVFPGVDLLMPLSWSQGLSGNAATLLAGSKDAGTYSIGVAVDVQQKYRFDLKYTTYFGKDARNATNTADVFNGTYALLRDRANVSLTFKTTF
ncbi:MAG: DUF1302 domain-containing protein [Zoogloeaceae bacterium]|jgi:hypothetical protein|nr:DUF1302 domain-containing protein [Zoogloeaceae bacterium]